MLNLNTLAGLIRTVFHIQLLVGGLNNYQYYAGGSITWKQYNVPQDPVLSIRAPYTFYDPKISAQEVHRM